MSALSTLPANQPASHAANQAALPAHFIGWSLEQISLALQERRISALALAQMCIARMQQVEAQSLAWQVFDAEKLLQLAKATDAYLAAGGVLRPLEGIPVGVKDIFNTVDFATEMGSPLWQGFTPGNDARVVFHLRRAGALIPGKTVTAEFAVHSLGKTLNPHDRLHNPGTSSSGSAVAVACGVVPVALGTQTAGSIVRPASYCGVYGCKPSFGLIPRTGMLKTTDTLDTIGFFASCADDMRRVWQSLRVQGRDYPIAERVFANPERSEKPKNRPWKIAFVRTHTWAFAEEYAQTALQNWVAQLGGDQGYEVHEVELPSITKQAHQVHATIYERTLHYYFQEEFKRGEFVSPIMNQLLARGRTIALDDFKQALHLQEMMAHQMDELLSEYDAMVSLSTAGAAPLRNAEEKPDPALVWTLSHLAVVAAPAFCSPQGLPFGMQLVARRYNDLQLFHLLDDLCAAGYLPSHQYPALPY